MHRPYHQPRGAPGTAWGVGLLALSLDPVADHERRRAVNELRCGISLDFPVIGDTVGGIAERYDVLAPSSMSRSNVPTRCPAGEGGTIPSSQ